MVSTGETAISLHIQAPQNFIFVCGGGGYSSPTQTQSAKICPNFQFGGWGGGDGVFQTNITEIYTWTKISGNWNVVEYHR